MNTNKKKYILPTIEHTTDDYVRYIWYLQSKDYIYKCLQDITHGLYTQLKMVHK